MTQCETVEKSCVFCNSCQSQQTPRSAVSALDPPPGDAVDGGWLCPNILRPQKLRREGELQPTLGGAGFGGAKTGFCKFCKLKDFDVAEN